MSEEKKSPLPPVGCVRVADVEPGTVPPEGITKTACDGCGHEVYISPSSREMVEEGICRPLCYPCVMKMAEAGTRFAPTMTEAQLDVKALNEAPIRMRRAIAKAEGETS